MTNMVTVERLPSGGAILRGRKPHEVIEVPRWPCSCVTVRRHAVGVGSKWLDEAAEFANEQLDLD